MFQVIPVGGFFTSDFAEIVCFYKWFRWESLFYKWFRWESLCYKWFRWESLFYKWFQLESFLQVVQVRQQFNKVVIKQKGIMITCSNFKIDAAKFIELNSMSHRMPYLERECVSNMEMSCFICMASVVVFG